MTDQARFFLDHKPGRSPANRSLERGVEILRAFRPGSELLGNGELAERTGLSKATVSRLTQTLVGSGMLQLDKAERAYRLAPAVLSLSHAMRTASRVLQAAAPRMLELARQRHINVGLAAPDRDEMVYLESIRYARRAALRHVVSGQRVPMELTSLGRAYLASLTPQHRTQLMQLLSKRRVKWKGIESEIRKACTDVRTRGFCAAAWQPEVVALATPLEVEGSIYVLNISLSTQESIEAIAQDLGPSLLALAQAVRHELAVREPRSE
ncbi:IclR family transcriptional regulator [Variovorax guangxiensis]|uniref:IclR family transcriptional regulator n=1 Tax=Variovorax guangxiensis TaxID=1775474 RepID=A0A3S0ZRJ1_9BURK|nr:IclR family transcriptional regulator [Variovorax guangxiensis]RUR70365.1 IclR family transcriptional regulator [Variovorax guangxiensis]